MVNKSGTIGTKGETGVVRVLIPNGWPNAERRRLRGKDDPGDITGTPGIAWSIKAGEQARSASDLDVSRWLARTEDMRRNTRSDVGVLVMHRRGFGYERAGDWWAVTTSWTVARLVAPDVAIYGPDGDGPGAPDVPQRMRLIDMLALLRWAGYGDPVEVSA